MWRHRRHGRRERLRGTGGRRKQSRPWVIAGQKVMRAS
ncbi:phage DNA packaging protein J [Pseudomonas trivialis]